MKVNPVIYCTFIIRSQAEYSALTQSVNLRCILQWSATGQQQGFSDVDTLLAVLRAALLTLQAQTLPQDIAPSNPKNEDC